MFKFQEKFGSLSHGHKNHKNTFAFGFQQVC